MPPWPGQANTLRVGRALVSRLVVVDSSAAVAMRRARRVTPAGPASPTRRAGSVRAASVDAQAGGRAYGSAAAAPPPPGATPLPTLGRIEIITGPMFAGKSTELLRRVAAHEAAGRTVLVFASAKDTRYAPGGGAVVTHTGASRPTTAAGPTLAAAAAAAGGPAALASADVLAIDEAQFFPDLVPFTTAAADAAGKTVIVAGLDGDFRRRPFGGVGSLLPHADAITKLSATCAVCGGAAHFSVRLAPGSGAGGNPDAPTPPGSPLKRQSLEGPQVVVGGAERYAAVCRVHYNEATAPVEGEEDGSQAAQAAVRVWAAVVGDGRAPTAAV